MAEAALATADQVALGTGSLKRTDANRLSSELRRTASAQHQRAKPVSPADLNVMGISYVVEPPAHV